MLPAVQANAGNGGASRPPVAGIEGWSSTNYYVRSASGIINPGADTTFWFAALFTITSVSGGTSTKHIYKGSAGSPNRGFSLLTTNPNTNVTFRYTDSGAVLRSASVTGGYSSADVNKVALVVGVKDSSQGRLYSKRALAATSPTGSGYDNLSGVNTGVGADGVDGTFPMENMRIHGLAGGSGVPSDATIFAWYDAVKAAGALVSMSGATTSWLANFTATGTIVPSVGSGNLTQVGTGLVVSQTPGNYTW